MANEGNLSTTSQGGGGGGSMPPPSPPATSAPQASPASSGGNFGAGQDISVDGNVLNFNPAFGNNNLSPANIQNRVNAQMQQAQQGQIPGQPGQNQQAQNELQEGGQQQRIAPPAFELNLDDFLNQAQPDANAANNEQPAGGLTTSQQQQFQEMQNFFQSNGGQERLQQAGKYYGQLTAPNFNPDDVLSTIASEMPQRYSAIVDRAVARHAPQIYSVVVNDLLANPGQYQDAILEAAGWNAQEYAVFKQLKESGQLANNLHPDIAQAKAEAQRANERAAKLEQQAFQQQQKSKLVEFKGQTTKPMTDILTSIKLPNNEWGTQMAGHFINMIESTIRSNPLYSQALEAAENDFMNGEDQLAYNRLPGLKAAYQNTAKQVLTFFAPILKGYAESQYARAKAGQSVTEPGKNAMAGGGIGTAPQMGQQPQTPQNPYSQTVMVDGDTYTPDTLGHQNLSKEALMRRINNTLGIR